SEKERGSPARLQPESGRGGHPHIKTESEEETHRYWDTEWHEFLKSVAWLSPASPPPSEEDAKDFQGSLGRVREEPRQGSSGEAPRDPNVRGKAWIGRKKLESCRKMKETLEKMGMERQWPLHLKQFNPQDTERAQPKTFSLKRLASVFSGVNKILSELESMDPDVERFRRVHWEMREILKCYREIYEEKRKESVESRHSGFLKKIISSPVPVPSLLPFRSTVKEHPDDPQPSTSYASGSDVPENLENHEPFKGYVSDLMFTVIPKNTMLKSPKQEEEAFEIVKVKIPMDIKQESDGEAN
ncbi:hypothetical protein NXF25_004459, partial [Crotalus adamanteus]